MINVLKNHAQANVHLHMMNIEAYFKNPAGIGEHSDIMEAIQGEMDKMAVHEDRLQSSTTGLKENKMKSL